MPRRVCTGLIVGPWLLLRPLRRLGRVAGALVAAATIGLGMVLLALAPRSRCCLSLPLS